MQEKIANESAEKPEVINVDDAFPKGKVSKARGKAKSLEKAQEAEREAKLEDEKVKAKAEKKAKVKAEKKTKKAEKEAAKLKRLEETAAKELKKAKAKAKREKLSKFRSITMSRTTMQFTIPANVRDKALKACNETCKSIKPSGKMTLTMWDPEESAIVTRIVAPE